MFDRMVFDQDELAKEADRERKKRHAQDIQKTKAMFDKQVTPPSLSLGQCTDDTPTLIVPASLDLKSLVTSLEPRTP